MSKVVSRMPHTARPVARRCIILSLLGLVLFCSGCVRRQEIDDSVLFSVEPSVTIGIAASAAVVLGTGVFFLRYKRKWIGILLMLASVVVLSTTVPGLASSRTLVGPNRFEWRSVFHVVEAEFDDLREIVHTTERFPVAGSTVTVHYLLLQFKDGHSTNVRAESERDDVFIEAFPENFRRAKEKGVQIKEPL